MKDKNLDMDKKGNVLNKSDESLADVQPKAPTNGAQPSTVPVDLSAALGSISNLDQMNVEDQTKEQPKVKTKVEPEVQPKEQPNKQLQGAPLPDAKPPIIFNPISSVPSVATTVGAYIQANAPKGSVPVNIKFPDGSTLVSHSYTLSGLSIFCVLGTEGAFYLGSWDPKHNEMSDLRVEHIKNNLYHLPEINHYYSHPL